MFSRELQRDISYGMISPIKTAEQRMDYSVEIRKVESDKKRYLNLLLLADEQEDMVDRYLERGIHLRVRGTDSGYGVKL